MAGLATAFPAFRLIDGGGGDGAEGGRGQTLANPDELDFDAAGGADAGGAAAGADAGGDAAATARLRGTTDTVIIQLQAGQCFPGSPFFILQISSVFRRINRCVDQVPFLRCPPTVLRRGNGDSHAARSSD